MADTYIVVSKVKKFLKDQGFRTSTEVLETLSGQVVAACKDAAARAEADGRRTVKAEDLQDKVAVAVEAVSEPVKVEAQG
jgi:histone H3/H4